MEASTTASHGRAGRSSAVQTPSNPSVRARSSAGPGSPSPLAVHSSAVPGHRLDRGEQVPRGTAVVVRKFPAGASVPSVVRLTCPSGMVVAGLVPNPDTRLTRAYDPRTRLGRSTIAVVRLQAAKLERPAQIATLCRTRGAALRRP